MGDDFSQLDEAIGARFRAVGWRAAGECDRDEAHTEPGGREQYGNGMESAIAPRPDPTRGSATRSLATKEMSALQSIGDRLSVVAEVLNRRSLIDGRSGNGTDPQVAALRAEMTALRADITEVKTRLESLATVLVEFGNLTRRTMASTTTEVLVEVGKLGDQVARLTRSSRPRPEISRNQPIVREH